MLQYDLASESLLRKNVWVVSTIDSIVSSYKENGVSTIVNQGPVQVVEGLYKMNVQIAILKCKPKLGFPF